MYRIGMFSKLSRTTIKTLHHYDEVGLLKPTHVDNDSGYRYYSSSELLRLNEIIALRQMGFSLAEISALVDGRNTADIITRHLRELQSEVQTVTDQLFRLNNYIKQQKEGHTMEYQAVIKEIPAYTIYCANYTLPNYAALNDIMPELGKKVAKNNPGLKCVQPDYCFNVYLDGEYKESDIQVDICQAVVSRGCDGDGIVFKEIPAITAVSVLHRGSYENLGAAYTHAVQWVEENGYSIVDNVRESFIDGIWNKTDEADWLTEIQVPVEKK